MSQETHVNSFKELGGRKVCMSFVKMRLGRLISGAKKGKKGPGSRAPMDVAEYLPGGLMTDDVQQVPERWLESCNATTSRNTRVLIFGGGEIYGVKSEDPFYSPSHGGLSRRKSHTHVEKGARCQGSGSASEKFATTKVTNK
ncbi:hypothetical protein MCOR07_002861 [Pyricularia oryzae]|nr:hypothetical protein MCOR01_000409 [Pyricularia oryzae]KAI6418170.1 hypothetical protein MCOR24_005591 [Pyricularia oryzae]KAI6625550.1 hypothetical protein MCOR07_002861 [Pyricularia oryzae]